MYSPLGPRQANGSQYHAPAPYRPPPPGLDYQQPYGYDHQQQQQQHHYEAPPSSYPPPFSQPDQFKVGPPFRQDDPHDINRTPSPTPSEVKALGKEDSFLTKIRQPGYWKSKEGIIMIVTIVIGVALSIGINYGLLELAKLIHPHRQKLRSIKFGFLAPVGLLVIVSFPPLIGHELIAPLCAMVYGLWPAFAIVCAGTMLGEIANFIVFRYACRARAEKLQVTNIQYGTIAEATRQGGFKVMLSARYSVLPPHVITPIFATSGVNFFAFLLAAALALPRQFIVTYTGTFLDEQAQGKAIPKNEKNKTNLIQTVVLIITIITTIIAWKYVKGKMEAVKPQIIYARRKARQAHPEMFPKKKNHKGSESTERLTFGQAPAV